MDIVTAIVILGSISLVVIPLTLVLRGYYSAKAALSRKMSAIRASKRVNPASVPATQAEMPGWLPGLLEELGVGSELLEGDEIPPELAKFLPAVKGFIDTGGLEKLLGSGSSGGQDKPEPENWF